MQESLQVPIALNVDVECLDGKSGKSCHIIINPVNQIITHFVVENKHFPESSKRLVPLEKIIETTDQIIRLGCTKAELAALEKFTETHYIKTEPSNIPAFSNWKFGIAVDTAPIMMYPYVIPKSTQAVYVPNETERIPTGEMAVKRGAEVFAEGDKMGVVDEFLVEPNSGHITHLIMGEQHLWQKKEIMIPISAIDKMYEDLVYLKITKATLENLPTIPIKRFLNS